MRSFNSDSIQTNVALYVVLVELADLIFLKPNTYLGLYPVCVFVISLSGRSDKYSAFIYERKFMIVLNITLSWPVGYNLSYWHTVTVILNVGTERVLYELTDVSGLGVRPSHRVGWSNIASKEHWTKWASNQNVNPTSPLRQPFMQQPLDLQKHEGRIHVDWECNVIPDVLRAPRNSYFYI